MARRQPVPINREDFEKMIDHLVELRDKYWMPRAKKFKARGKRYQQYLIAMILGFGSGMRISEILGLNHKQRYVYTNKQGETTDTILESNIPNLTPDRIEEKYIRILHGKGKKDRVVPLPIKLFRKAKITKQILLKNLPLKITRRSTQNFVSEIGRKVLKKHITFHMLRHGFITELLNSGMPTHQVQIFSGHSRLDTLGIYAHANPAEALNKYQEVF